MPESGETPPELFPKEIGKDPKKKPGHAEIPQAPRDRKWKRPKDPTPKK